MPVNVEIKARVCSLDAVRKAAAALAGGADADVDGSCCKVLKQRDVFFAANQGRLKLRYQTGMPAQLIAYDRSDVSGPRTSDYAKTLLEKPEELEQVLAKALGVRGEVKTGILSHAYTKELINVVTNTALQVSKTRYLYMVGQTRVHCDKVEGLGDFAELEVGK